MGKIGRSPHITEISCGAAPSGPREYADPPLPSASSSVFGDLIMSFQLSRYKAYSALFPLVWPQSHRLILR